MKNLILSALMLILSNFYAAVFGQEEVEISDLFVTDYLQEDSIYSLSHIQFNCNDITNFTKVEIVFYDEMQNEINTQQLLIVEKETGKHLRLMNNEEIKIHGNFFSFMTPLSKPGWEPYFSISVRGILIDNNYTNSLTFIRQINY